jgi:hypothetical protein
MKVHQRFARKAAAAACLVLAVTSVSTVSASASGGGVEKSGICTKGSTWKLKASPDDGRIKVEAEVDSGVNGQHWTWSITHNGGTSASGTATTQDGGTFKVQRLLIDVPGTDGIGWISTNIVSKERCKGHLKY